ncbi:MAG: S8 family serine peptidase, partial [Burkholderiaceae bacterium]
MDKTQLARAALCAALLAPVGPMLPLGVAQSQGTPAALTARVIVKYKADAVLLRKRALSVGDQHAVQAQALGQRNGIVLRTGAALHDRAQVVFAGGMSSQQLATRLAQDSEVEYAVPDARKRATLAPNDPLYTSVGGNGPASGQWYLRANGSDVKSSIDVEPAWDITTGNVAVVVAVLDTGVRFEHPDLKTVANGGNLLSGYDMIDDVDTANDSNGRDPDASDPGDWISQADIGSGRFSPCTSADITDSSWHGTQTAGLIAALTNNGVGMASVGRGVRVLPVRVLGKCGGFDSDIIAGMRWAAGLSVPGVPANALTNRAKVINMSLGGPGACTQAYQEAVNEINAAGVTIVASAGNSTGHAVSSPANCVGVIAVAGLRHAGSKVGFSDLGPEIAISAPAGNCVNEGPNDPCLYPILTSSDSGLTTPASAIYTDSFNASLGTSFSAPLVAGASALMLSVQASLSPAEVRAILGSTARPFPSSGASNGSDPNPVPQCQAPGANDQLQCYCTTSTCGAGMLDAGAAVQRAAGGVLPRVTLSPASPLAGQVLTLGSSTSLVGSGRSIAGYLWAITDAGGIVTGFTGATNGASATITPGAAGRFTVSLTVTDDLGAQTTTTSDIVVSAAVVARITFSPSSPLPGQAVSLSAATSTLASGRSIASYQWAIANPGGIVTAFAGTTTQATASITPSAAG